MNSNSVVYDCVMRSTGYQYRSELLYQKDRDKVLRTRRGAEVQVIAEHGDATWTDAILTGCEQVDPELGMVRFVVIIDGREHKVSEDRIRVRNG